MNHKIPLIAGRMYHIWTHANGTENLFRSKGNYRYFLKKYAHFIHPVAETFAYCLMPNHLHVMVRIREKETVLEYVNSQKKEAHLKSFAPSGRLSFSNVISRQFSHLFNSYTQASNKQYNRKGSLFIPNFKRKFIDSPTYYTALIAYIHNNPVHHGFSHDPLQWPHSS